MREKKPQRIQSNKSSSVSTSESLSRQYTIPPAFNIEKLSGWSTASIGLSRLLTLLPASFSVSFLSIVALCAPRRESSSHDFSKKEFSFLHLIFFFSCCDRELIKTECVVAIGLPATRRLFDGFVSFAIVCVNNPCDFLCNILFIMIKSNCYQRTYKKILGIRCEN